MLRPASILILCFILFNSCSIKKRAYRKGYYIDWIHHKKNKVSGDEIKAKEITEQPIILSSKNVFQIQQQIKEPVLTENSETVKTVTSIKTKQQTLSNPIVVEKVVKHVTVSKAENPPKRKLSTYAYLILGFTIVGLVFPALGIVTILLAPTALKEIKDEPDKYKGEKLIRICRVICWIYIVVMALMFILLVGFLFLLLAGLI